MIVSFQRNEGQILTDRLTRVDRVLAGDAAGERFRLLPCLLDNYPFGRKRPTGNFKFFENHKKIGRLRIVKAIPLKRGAIDAPH